MSQMKFWLLMLGLSMSWLFIIPEIIILILLIIGVGKYEILVTGIDHIFILMLYIHIITFNSRFCKWRRNLNIFIGDIFKCNYIYCKDNNSFM